MNEMSPDRVLKKPELVTRVELTNSAILDATDVSMEEEFVRSHVISKLGQ